MELLVERLCKAKGIKGFLGSISDGEKLVATSLPVHLEAGWPRRGEYG